MGSERKKTRAMPKRYVQRAKRKKRIGGQVRREREYVCETEVLRVPNQKEIRVGDRAWSQK